MSSYHFIHHNKAVIGRLALRGLSILSILVLLLGTPLQAPAQAAAGILYAVPGGKTSGNCDSWSSACELSQALKIAASGSEIWVKAGMYLPGSRPGDAFLLRSGVAVYGGFLGMETARDQANWYTHPTVLSGDIAGDDLPDLTHMEENSHHVVVADGVDASAVLNGFFIRSGSALGTGGDGMGGGVEIMNASPTLKNLVLSFNDAERGAGIGCYGKSYPVLTNIAYEKNRAKQGGGLSAEAGCVVNQFGGVFNTNRAETGGAIYNNAATLFVVNASISGNTASLSGGGIGNYSVTVLENSIVWNNHRQQALDQISNQGGVVFALKNIIQGGYNGYNNRDVDPRFAGEPTSGPDQAWGTADDTPGNLMLRYESPAIDAGDSRIIIDPQMRDMRNWPRIIDHPRPDTQVGPLVDLGGYEAGIIFARQKATGRNDGSSWGDAFSTVPDALAFTHAGDEVWVAAGTYQVGADRASTFRLKNEVAVYGGFAGSEVFRDERNWISSVSILSGAIATGPNKVHHVVSGINVGPSAVLDGFTIQDGAADGTQAPDNRGGGIYLENASPTLQNLILSRNAAMQGGGVYFTGSQAGALTNVTLLINQAEQGGGLYLDHASISMRQLVLQENRAVDGGALYILNSNYSLMDSTFLRNKATNGAGIANVGIASPNLANVYFYGNVASTNGGGMYNLDGASPDISNAIFAGNEAVSAGGMYNLNGSAPTLRNATMVSNPGGAFYSETNDAAKEPSLLNVIGWNNSAQPIIALNSSPVIMYSLLEGGCPSQLNESCVNVLSNDPQFFQMPGPGADGKWGTADDDYGDLRLLPGSKAIDAGMNSAVLPGITTDIAGRPRFIDDPNTVDTGLGTAPIVDMGAYETRFAPSTTEITGANPVSSYAGQAVQVSFKVSGDRGAATGPVEVTDGAAKCSAPADQGQCTLTFTTPGQKTLTAHFTGDITYDSSYSDKFAYQVSRIPVEVSLSLDPPGNTGVGHKVQASFVLSPGIDTTYLPGGTVTISSDNASCIATVTQGACDLIFSKPGTYIVKANYSGDTFFDPKSSNEITYTIQALRATKTTLSISPITPTRPGEIVTAEFSVDITDPQGGTATGSVQVLDGEKEVCRVVMVNGKGKCPVTLSALGRHQLFAVYAGEDIYGPSRSDPVTHQVGNLIYLNEIHH